MNTLFPLTPPLPRNSKPSKAPTITSSLKERGILVDHSGGYWEWHRRDRRVEKSVADSASVSRSAVTAHKNLFLGCDGPLDAIRTVVLKSRESHTNMTLPWAPSRNLLLNSAVLRYKEVQSRHSVSLEQAKLTLSQNWPAMLTASRQSLGPLYSPDDYPDLPSVLSAAYITHKFYPIADASDVRLSCDADLVAEIQQQVRIDEAETYNSAVLSVWDRFLSVMRSAVTNLVKGLDPKSAERYRSEWHDNLANLLPLLSSLNLNSDPRLDEMALRASTLLRPDPEEYKVSLTVRSTAALQAQRIYDDLSSIYSTLPGSKKE